MALTSFSLLFRYPLSNYQFLSKTEQRDPTFKERMAELNMDFNRVGKARVQAEAVLIVHHQGTPHVLFLEGSANFYKL